MRWVELLKNGMLLKRITCFLICFIQLQNKVTEVSAIGSVMHATGFLRTIVHKHAYSPFKMFLSNYASYKM